MQPATVELSKVWYASPSRIESAFKLLVHPAGLTAGLMALDPQPKGR